MLIPKSKMPLIDAMLDAALDSPLGHSLEDDEYEIINQIRKHVSLCQDGDAPFLEIEVCYADKPHKPTTGTCSSCGNSGFGDCPEC